MPKINRRNTCNSKQKWLISLMYWIGQNVLPTSYQKIQTILLANPVQSPKQINKKKANNQIETWVEYINRHFIGKRHEKLMLS